MTTVATSGTISETEQLGLVANSLISATMQLDDIKLDLWAAMGLTIPQLRLLMLLKHEDGQSNAALAEALGIERPSVSALLERLETGSFIRREIDDRPQGDRRNIRVFLEARGRQAVSHFDPQIKDQAQQLVKAIPANQLQKTAQMLTKIGGAQHPTRGS